MSAAEILAVKRLATERKQVDAASAELHIASIEYESDPVTQNDNLYSWHVKFNDIPNSPYTGSRYQLNITFPRGQYPTKAPEFRWSPHVPFHPAIDPSGQIGCPMYRPSEHKPGTLLVDTLRKIVGQLAVPTVDEPTNKAASDLLKADPAAFKAHCQDLIRGQFGAN